VFEAPAEIIVVAMFRDSREVLPGALASEDSDVMPHPEEGEHGGGSTVRKMTRNAMEASSTVICGITWFHQ